MLDNDSIREFYRGKLAAHGASAEGVGWKDSHAQRVRFDQLIKVIDATPFSINDLGCGTGGFVEILESAFGDSFTYVGYDPVPEMIVEARRQVKPSDRIRFEEITAYDEMETADFTVASGIFNVRNNVPEANWQAFIMETLEVMNSYSRKGFAFNALTKYSDPALMRPDLYYSDPLFLFDHCKKAFSKQVALLHDYGIFDFTILVRKEKP